MPHKKLPHSAIFLVTFYITKFKFYSLILITAKFFSFLAHVYGGPPIKKYGLNKFKASLNVSKIALL